MASQSIEEQIEYAKSMIKNTKAFIEELDNSPEIWIFYGDGLTKKDELTEGCIDGIVNLMLNKQTTITFT